MTDIQFMRRIRKRLIDVGLDFADLGKATGLNRSTFSRAYNGITEMRESTKELIERKTVELTKKGQ